MQDPIDFLPLDETYPEKLSGLERFTKEERELIEDALQFAKKHHGLQKRAEGTLFFKHPVAVAQLLLTEFSADYQVVIAGLLHDLAEDTDCSLEDIETRYGERVKFLVDGCTEVGRGDDQPFISDKKQRTLMSQEKILEFSKKDNGVTLIKCADRWHNICTCLALPRKNQRAMAETTLDFFVPLCGIINLELAAKAVLVRLSLHD